MSELKFSRVNNEEYNTVSINIENAFIEIKEEDYQIEDIAKTKYGYNKANNMSELKFSRVNNEEYNTVSINIENAFIEIKEEDYQIEDIAKTKYGYNKANIRIFNDDLKNKLKIWETEINEYLKNEVGTEAISILYGNKIYPKLSALIGQEKNEQHIKIKSVWINEKNKPFIQLYYVRHT